MLTLAPVIFLAIGHMKAQVTWNQGVKFIAESGSGHRLVMDGPEEHGGKNQGPRPMELLLLGMGGCASFDVVHILKRQRQQIETCVAHLQAERAEVEPKVFTRIHTHYVISGKNLIDDKVKRAIELSIEKYCSASIMLGKTAEITYDYEIIEN